LAAVLAGASSKLARSGKLMYSCAGPNNQPERRVSHLHRRPLEKRTPNVDPIQSGGNCCQT
jgi:hypothetical protein